MSDPYFPGQRASKCGHYYPDVLRLRDERKPDGTFVRVVDCKYCGRYELLLDIESLSPVLARKLKRKGIDEGIKEKDLAKVREKEMKRLMKNKR